MRWDTQRKEGCVPSLQKELSPGGPGVTACAPSTLREKPSSGPEWHCAPLCHQHQPFPCGPRAQCAPAPAGRLGSGQRGFRASLWAPNTAMGTGWLPWARAGQRAEVTCRVLCQEQTGASGGCWLPWWRGWCWFCQVIPLESFCGLEALPPPSWAAGGRGASSGPLSLLSLPWPTPCHLWSPVDSAHTGVLIILYFFFFLGNCRIIKYFNFKVSNFLLHT